MLSPIHLKFFKLGGTRLFKSQHRGQLTDTWYVYTGPHTERQAIQDCLTSQLNKNTINFNSDGTAVYEFVQDRTNNASDPEIPGAGSPQVGLAPGRNEPSLAAGSPAPRTRSCAPAAARLPGTGRPLAPAAPQRAFSSRAFCFWGPGAAA